MLVNELFAGRCSETTNDIVDCWLSYSNAFCVHCLYGLLTRQELVKRRMRAAATTFSLIPAISWMDYFINCMWTLARSGHINLWIYVVLTVLSGWCEWKRTMSGRLQEHKQNSNCFFIDLFLVFFFIVRVRKAKFCDKTLLRWKREVTRCL